MKYIIGNANFFNNGYEEIIKRDSFLNMCMDTQKNLANNKDIFYKLFDYNDKVVKEAKEKMKNILEKNDINFSENDIFNSKETDNRLNLTIFVDTIRAYIQSIIENIIFIDNDVLIYNKVEFLNSTLNKTFCKSNALDQIIIGNNNNLDLFKKMFEFRINNEITNKNYDDLKLNKRARKIFNFEKVNVKGALHLPKYKKMLKNIILVKDYNDLKKLNNENEKRGIVILLNNKITIPKFFLKNKKLLDFNLCDDFSKNKVSSFFNL